jgi:hypothetical protein
MPGLLFIIFGLSLSKPNSLYMTAASRSLYIFAIYLLVLGIVLIVMPNALLATFQLPETNEVWIRVVGMLVFNLGLYYYFMAPANNVLFLTLTVYVRALVIVWFTVFVLMDWVSPRLLLFGVVDLLAAAWTFFALRK